MADEFRSEKMRLVGLKTGAKVGLVTGVSIGFFTWFAAAMLKGLITDFTGIWPESFAGAPIVDFILSRWWIVLVVLSFTAVGALVGVIRQRRYELL
jgi:uncharacterized membrane protein YoaT (DUF817 family)